MATDPGDTPASRDPVSVAPASVSARGPLLPEAASVAVLDASSQAVLAEMVCEAEVVWSAVVRTESGWLDYRLRVRWRSGEEQIVADAYAFGSLIGEADRFGEATARAILAPNRTGRRLCGW